MLVLRTGMGRGRGALLARLLHDSKLRKEGDGEEGGGGEAVVEEEGGDVSKATEAQQGEEAGSFLASLPTDAEMMMEEEEEAGARKRQCVKDILQERAERGEAVTEADGMRDGNERVVKEIAQQLMQLLQLATSEDKAHKPGGSGSAAKTASEEAALHAWLKALGKEGRLVRAWLKPRLDEAVKKLEGQWLATVKLSTWGLQWEGVGSAKPATGEEIQNAALAEALEGTLELTQDELEQLQVQDELCSSSHIRVGGAYLRPVKPVEAWVRLSEVTKTMSLGRAVEILTARTSTFNDLAWILKDGVRARLWREALDASRCCHGRSLQTSERSAFLAISEALGDELKPDLYKLMDVLKDPRKVLGELHKVLVAPIAGALEGAAEVLIIPHGDLLAVPWAALLDESRAEQHRYLIQRHVVRVAPSLRVARAAARAVASRSPAQQSRAVVVGNPVPNTAGPLPFAEMEAREVAAMIKAQAGAGAGGSEGGVVVLMREEASTPQVLDVLQDADHVHSAGHATPETLLLA